MTKEELQAFCSKEDIGVRIITSKPFSKGDFTYATNGHLAVWLPRFEDAEEVDKSPDMERTVMPYHDELAGQMRPLRAPIPPPADLEECPACDGTGREHSDCPECVCQCPGCDGTGKEDENTLVKIGERYFRTAYMRQIEKLQGLVISENGKNALAFRFDGGGKGLLMPVRSVKNYVGFGYTVLDVEL